MADPGLVQRGLKNLSESVHAVRTGEGESASARLGQSFKRAGKKAKSSFARLTTLLGLTVGLDAYDDDVDDQRRRKRARALIGGSEIDFVAKSPGEHRDLAATVAPEFRAQVASGLAAANSHTMGSTLADAPTSAIEDHFDEN